MVTFTNLLTFYQVDVILDRKQKTLDNVGVVLQSVWDHVAKPAQDIDEF